MGSPISPVWRTSVFRRRLGVLLPLAGVALAGPGCGTERGGGGSATVEPNGRLTVRADEYIFKPQDITTSNGRFSVTVVNDGDLAHNWKVFKGSTGKPDNERAGTETFQHGERRTVRVALRPGTYRIVCTVGNHDDLGMAGKLVVRR
jgi:plastocyanin